MGKPSRSEFERLVREHHAAVYRGAMRVLGQRQAAEDVAQQVFVAVLEGRSDPTRGRDEGAVLRWLAVRTALSHLRGERHRRRREEQHAMQPRQVERPSRVEREDERGLLERLIAELPDDLRLALRLRFEEELTYARVGEALSISEPAAHDRVRRALEGLRSRLRRSGLGALALDLEPRLSNAAGAPVPPDLLGRLLALPAAAAWSAGVAPTLAAGLLALVVGGTWLLARPDAEGVDAALHVAPLHSPTTGGEEDELASAPGTVGRDPVAGAPASRVRPPQNAQGRSPTGRILGVVRDAAGAPVAGASVTAATVERQGKFAREAVQAITRADGGYELEVPVLSDDGTFFRLSSIHDGLTARRNDPLRVAAGARVDAGELRLAGSAHSLPGPWTLQLRVVDPDRFGVEGAVVRVFPRGVAADGSGVTGSLEAYGVTAAGGWLELTGEQLGLKRAVVDARSGGWRRRSLDLALEGAHTQVVALEPGLEIRGVLLDARGAPVEPRSSVWGSAPQVYASADDPNVWFEAEHEPGGRFRITALDALPHRLFLQSPTLSPILLEDVLPGEAELEVVVKRRDDTSDVGHHGPELHGVLRDASSGAPVAADLLAVEAEWIAGDGPLDFELDLRPNLLWARPRQTAMIGEEPEASDAFHLVGLRPGRYVVAARVPGYATALSAPIELDASGLVSGIELRLQRPARLSGVVLDVDGKPLEGVWVLLTGNGPRSGEVVAGFDREVRETDGRPAAWRSNRVLTDARGRFAHERLPPDLVCTLVALHPRRAAVELSGLRPGASGVTLRFELARQR